MVEVNTSESTPDGGSGGVEAGEYHWMIEEVEVQSNEYGESLKLVCSVLAGATSGQVGHKQTEFFQLAGKAVDRLRCLLVATHMMTDEEWKARIGQPLEFDEALLKGRQFCARIKIEPYGGKKEEHKGKSFPKMNFNIWSVWDERSKHIPKDQECIAMLGAPPAAAAQQKSTAASPTTTPAAQPPQTQQAPSSSKFSW